MRYDQIHSTFIDRHVRGFELEGIDHFRSDVRRVLPNVSDRAHIATVVTFEETLANHLRMSHKRERKDLSFKILDEDYSNVESYLRQAFRSKASLYASDVADALGLDYGIVREIIVRMIVEGKLATK